MRPLAGCRVFDGSWELLSASVFTYDDFERVTHIWFSHEHPDHFFPPNLAKIPEPIRQQITVLFQATRDKRVIRHCQSLGFKAVVELDPEWVWLSKELKIYCKAPYPGAGVDSWLVVATPSARIVNMNDCECADAELAELLAIAGEGATLITQFSIACWQANPDDRESWEREARESLRRVRDQITALHPNVVVPAASFVRFCHDENLYMNNYMNSVHEAEAVIRESGATPVVLYPGDVWHVGAAQDCTSALSRYAADYKRRSARTSVAAVSGSIDALLACGNRFLARFKASNGWLLRLRLGSARIRVADLDATLELSWRGVSTVEGGRADIQMNSSALAYCFEHAWGGETLYINGRFTAPPGGDVERFFRWVWIARANGYGERYGFAHYVKRLWQIAGRRR